MAWPTVETGEIEIGKPL